MELETLTEYDLSCLHHMVGASEHVKKADQGYRNHFAAGSNEQIESMERMLKHGLVIKGREGENMIFYHATRDGCKHIGMSKKAIDRALE